MLEVYKSDVFGLEIEHSKTFLTTKTSCVIIHYPITIYLSALFFHGLHVMGIINSLSLCDLVWWCACYTATWRAMPAGALAPVESTTLDRSKGRVQTKLDFLLSRT